MKKMMKALILMLAIGSGAALVGCSVSPAEDGNGFTPVQTIKASELQKSIGERSDLKLDAAALGFSEQTSADLTCGVGRHWSCYDPADCACCPTGKVLDCLGPDDCYCCSGTTCM